MNKIDLENWLKNDESMNDIAKKTGFCLGTIRYWCKKYNLKSQYGIFSEKSERGLKSTYKSSAVGALGDESHLDYTNWSEDQQRAYSYLLGFYLGDGCLAYNRKVAGRSYTLIITNHVGFSVMNQRIKDSIKCLFPNKEIGTYQKSYPDRKSNGIDIKVTGICLNLLFPHGDGRKHTRKIELTDWQNQMTEKYPQEFIKGLIESDGCRFAPQKKRCPSYIFYQFSNCSTDIHQILQNIAIKIGLKFTFRKVIRGKSDLNRAPIYSTFFYDRKSVKILESFIGPKC